MDWELSDPENLTYDSENQSLLYDEDEYVPYEDRPETYFVPALFAIIFIIGVLGNGTLILIFIRHRSMRNVPNMYICSLAIGDLLVILFCVPFTSTVYTVDSWPYGEVICKFSEFIKDISIGVSVFTLTALSADRYLAIVDPMRKLHSGSATRITLLIIAGVWSISTLIAIPSVLFSYVRVINFEPNQTILVCYPFPEFLGDSYPKFIVMFKFLAYYAIPLLLISYFYLMMARSLLLSTRNLPGEAALGGGGGGGAHSQIQGRKKVAKMVLSFVVLFALCFFPSHVFLLWFYFSPDPESNFNIVWNYIRIVGFCLSFMNSCLNPISLWCLSTTFRKYFNQHLFCCCCPPEGRRSNGVGRGTTLYRAELHSNTNISNITSRATGNRNGGGNIRSHSPCSSERNCDDSWKKPTPSPKSRTSHEEVNSSKSHLMVPEKCPLYEKSLHSGGEEDFTMTSFINSDSLGSITPT